MLLHYDSLKIRTADLISELKKAVERVSEVTEVPSRLIELPVKYKGKWGPDIGFIGEQNGVTEDEVGENPLGNDSLGGNGGILHRISSTYAT